MQFSDIQTALSIKPMYAPVFANDFCPRRLSPTKKLVCWFDVGIPMYRLIIPVMRVKKSTKLFVRCFHQVAKWDQPLYVSLDVCILRQIWRERKNKNSLNLRKITLVEAFCFLLYHLIADPSSQELTSCRDPIEPQYYITALVKFLPVCSRCGAPDEALVEDEVVCNLKIREKQVVWHICFLCRSDGLEPNTWGATSNTS